MRALAVVPARGGSKELPRKNVLPLAGLPLVGHALECAARAPAISRTVVSTDDDEVAEVAARLGGDVLRRPAELAGDETPMWPVLRHALEACDSSREGFDTLVLLQPTNPLRFPDDVAGVLAALAGRPDADGAITVSEPRFAPIWECVVERDGMLEQLVPEARRFERRQDVPRALYINGGVYAWRTAFVRTSGDWLSGRTIGYETPEARSISIDTLDDLQLCELLLESGRVALPWVALTA